MNPRVPYTEIEIGGLLIQEPMGLATNLLIVAFGVAAALRLRRTGPGAAPAFFALMASAHFAGGVAHAFYYVLGEWMHVVGWTFSAAGLAVLEWVSLRRTWPRGRRWERWVGVKLGLFVLLAALVRNFVVTALNAAVGLLLIVAPALVVAFRRDGAAVARWHLGAIAVLVAPGVVNALAWSPHRWFNANDLGHLLIVVALWMFYRGFAAERPA